MSILLIHVQNGLYRAESVEAADQYTFRVRYPRGIAGERGSPIHRPPDAGGDTRVGCDTATPGCVRTGRSAGATFRGWGYPRYNLRIFQNLVRWMDQ